MFNETTYNQLSGAKGKAEARAAAGLPPLQKQIDRGLISSTGEWIGGGSATGGGYQAPPGGGPAPVPDGGPQPGGGGLFDSIPSNYLIIGAAVAAYFLFFKKR